MATKPTVEPSWATDGGADIVEPASGKKATGWVVDEKPPAGFFNWYMNLMYLWKKFLTDVISFPDATAPDGAIEVDSSGHVSVPGRIRSEGGVANFRVAQDPGDAEGVLLGNRSANIVAVGGFQGNGTGTPSTVYRRFNIHPSTGITRNGVGDYTITLAQAISLFSVGVAQVQGASGYIVQCRLPSTTTVRVHIYTPAGAATDIGTENLLFAVIGAPNTNPPF